MVGFVFLRSQNVNASVLVFFVFASIYPKLPNRKLINRRGFEKIMTLCSTLPEKGCKL